MMKAPSLATDHEDRDLMLRVRDGDVRAFEEIYDRHSSQAFSLALRITGSSRLGEEATQDAFVGLWRGAHGYDTNRGTLRSWLLSMVRNRSIDCLRRETRHKTNVEIEQAPERWLQDSELTDELVATRDEAHRTRQLLLALPAEQRTVIELAYFEGLTQTEVADKMGIPLGTVKGRLRLGLMKMHQALVGAAALAPADAPSLLLARY